MSEQYYRYISDLISGKIQARDLKIGRAIVEHMAQTTHFILYI